MAAKVLFSPDAEADLEAIGDYIAADNPTAALRFVEKLRQRCLSLKTSPERGRQFNERFRVLIEGNYLIFYRVERVGDDTTVVISIIVHGARDLTGIFERR